jgi:hypothetical protein
MKAVSSSYVVRFAQLSALWAYAVTQPVFSLLDGNPEFLVVRGTTRAEVVAFALLLAFVPAALVVAAERLLSLVSRTAADVLHLVFVGVFVLPLAMLILQAVEPAAGPAVAGALAIAGAMVAIYLRWRPVRIFVTVSFVLPVIALASFVFGTRLVTEDAEGAHVQVGAEAPVVMIVFDELPVGSLLTEDGAIDRVRYPSFARLAASSTWYPRATAVHDHTTGAVPAILTGRAPREGSLPILSDHPENLFTLLGETYDLDVREEVTYLCPKRYCPRARGPLVERLSGLFGDVRIAFLHAILPGSLASGLPPTTGQWSGFANADRLLTADSLHDINRIVANRTKAIPRVIDDFIAGITPREPAATLHYVHLPLPHAPWRYFPSGREYASDLGVRGIHGRDEWVRERWLVEQEWQGHLLQVGYTDRLLGRILDRLEKTGLAGRALLVVVADHGIGFEPGVGRRGVSTENVADIARVPLFVRYPGQDAARVDRRAVSTLDVMPTIADVLNVRAPRGDGRSLLGAVDRKTVWMLSRDGSQVRVTPAEVDRDQSETLRRKVALFGEGEDSLFVLGTHSALLGRSLAGLDVRESGEGYVELEGRGLFGEVDTGSRFVPARITGTVRGVDLGPRVELAIAVNGTIAALTRSSRAEARGRFEALVPETAFRRGRNRVEVLAIAGTGDDVRLTRLGPPRT